MVGDMEKYFNENAQNLKEVYEIFRTTKYGRKLNLPPWTFDNYEDFKKLPIMDPKDIVFEDLFVPAKGLWCFMTSGASGKVKTIKREVGTIVEYPKEMDEMLRKNNTIFLHSKRRKGESYYETHDVNHKRMYPQGIFVEYKNRDELLQFVQRGDILFIIEYPLMVEWICYYLETALENKEILPKNIAKKKVYLELSGEPITEKRVENIVHRLEKIFQTEVEYFITYGSNEIGHIGTYVPALHGTKIMYEVNPSLFVEIINGEIIITPYRKYGTILFRYKTGDCGKLFLKEGKPFLKEIRKSEDEGIMYIAGGKINIPKLLPEIEKIVNNSILGIECIKKEDQNRGKCHLCINIHVPQNLIVSKKAEIACKVKELIMNFASLSIENYLGMFTIEIQFSTEPIKKKWFIVNNCKER
jgi:phenylacetate-coenzyme A ligase PaaK-like adenylate-forming protein